MKKILVYLLSLTIVFTPSLVFAGAAEKWEILENNYDHTKNTVNVTAKKVTQQAANSGVYKVRVPVTPATLGATIKLMLKGGIAVGAITAMVEGVGWVIDEASKTIKKLKPEQPDNVVPYFWCASYYKSCSIDPKVAADKFLNEIGPIKNFSSRTVTKKGAIYEVAFYTKDGSQPEIVAGTFNLNWTKNPFYDPTQKPEWIPVSDTEVGREATGEGNEPTSSPIPNDGLITEAYSPNNPVSDAPAPKETNNALDNAKPETDPDPDPKPDPDPDPKPDPDPDPKPDPSELPEFCTWAETICDWMEWTKEDPDQDSEGNDLPVKTPEPFDTSIFSKDRFSVSRQCPIPEQHTISLSGISVNFAFDLKPICSVLELARPALIACSYLYACYIVIGAARNG